MRDDIALLQRLTLPAGALTGQRIVLDGVTGLIQIFNSSNQLVGQIDPTGIFKSIDPVNGSTAILTADAATGIGAAGIILNPPPVGGHTVNKSNIFVYDDGAPSHRMHVQFASPGIDTLGGIILDMAGKDLNGIGPAAIFADGSGLLPGTAPVQIQGTLDVTGKLDSKRIGCRLRRVANQSINNAITTSITWDQEDEDTDNFIAAPSTTVTIPAGLAGLYAITFVPEPAVAIATRFLCEITPTSVSPGMPTFFRATGGAGENFMCISATMQLAAGDTFLCQVFQQNGAAVNFQGWLSCYRIGS